MIFFIDVIYPAVKWISLFTSYDNFSHEIFPLQEGLIDLGSILDSNRLVKNKFA